MQLCDYGCGQESKYQFKNGKWCCSENFRSCTAIRKKKSESMKGKKTSMRNKYKEIIIKIYDKATKQRWDKTWILIPYIQILFFINLYIVVLSLFPKLIIWKIIGLILLIILFFMKYYIIKYGSKYKNEKEKK